MIGESFVYPCGRDTLTGYLRCGTAPCKSLVVVVPGFNAMAEDYISVIENLAQKGFDVFIFDCLGSGKSGGKTSMGFPQIINDLDATLSFIKGNKRFDYDNIFLLGHSRGAYAACCMANSGYDISGVASVNGVDRAIDGIMAASVKAVGEIAYFNYCLLRFYQAMLFGKSIAEKSAISEINKSRLPTLIIQSENDEKISAEKFSIYAKRKNLSLNNIVSLLYCKCGKDGHTSILYNDQGDANEELILIITEFFKNISERRGQPDEEYGSHTCL